MDKVKKTYRFNNIICKYIEELKAKDEEFSYKLGTNSITETAIVEEAISFYYNYKTDQKVSYGIAPIIERIMIDSLNKYMENFVLSLNENQHHTIKTEKMCKLILAGLNITNDEELMKILLNKYTDFEMIIDDSIEKDKSKI